ncbi:DUF523 domain-containing protein [Thalassotalea profundi]|uniref:DUF523 domain-containing protein n=1 Tax=Thalassotalea profundi TaxID=2036687 RepID=A0ABQ3IQZ1_9GAMM|nr:DUF523 domain-containing protein [Thalassotalea profundi]GHE88671.1 hypothetical protein GCM10011501_17620 [Thalassotalea profundi]
MKKILVSACLLGEKVRYDGNSQQQHHVMLNKWQQQGRIISICPEVAGGLTIPREPAEIQPDSRVITQKGINVGHQFLLGAEKALFLCQKYEIRYALLKESSPSCGSHTIYDGTFSNSKISGMGVTAALLEENGIQVFSEHQIDELNHLLN